MPTAGAPEDQLVGTTLAERYTLLERLGSGGMGVVYRARQTAMERDVAVKVLAAERTLEAVQRFHREMRASALLSHPNCVQVHDCGQADGGQIYLVMELIEGETLGALLRRERRIEPRRAARIGAQIARGVGAAHARGLVHRDLKPDNVMLAAVVGEPELVKVLDFGVARAIGEDRWQTLTRPGAFAGTPRYAAPEQARGEDVGPACDLFSLGLLLFEMVTGRLPGDLEGGGPAERLAAAAGPAVPPALDALVASLIERDPARRPGSADEVAKRLAEVSSGTPDTLADGAFAGDQPPLPLAERVAQPLTPAVSGGGSTRRVPVLVAGLVVLLGLGSASYLGVRRYRLRSAVHGCDGGSADGCVALGLLHEDGKGGFARDPARAAALYQQACDAGSARGCFDLGRLFDTGTGVPGDETRAAALYRQACEGGNHDGCNGFGWMTVHGRGGVVKDEARGASLFKQSCENGVLRACSNYGWSFRNGRGVVRDQARAADYFKQACDGDDAAGCSNLGYQLVNGLGVPRDHDRGLALLRRGCNGGFPWGCEQLRASGGTR